MAKLGANGIFANERLLIHWILNISVNGCETTVLEVEKSNKGCVAEWVCCIP